MKKLLFLIFFLIGFSSFGGIRKKIHAEVKYGIETGLNIANLISNQQNALPNNFAFLWHVGVYSLVQFSDKVSFLPELLYSVKGADVVGPSWYWVTRYYYAEIPLQLKYNFNEHLNVFGGLYFGYLTLSYSTPAVRPGYYDQMNRFENGGTIGINYEFNNGFNCGFKTSTGFTSVFKEYDKIGPLAQAYNLVFSFYVAWTFK